MENKIEAVHGKLNSFFTVLASWQAFSGELTIS